MNKVYLYLMRCTIFVFAGLPLIAEVPLPGPADINENKYYEYRIHYDEPRCTISSYVIGFPNSRMASGRWYSIDDVGALFYTETAQHHIELFSIPFTFVWRRTSGNGQFLCNKVIYDEDRGEYVMDSGDPVRGYYSPGIINDHWEFSNSTYTGSIPPDTPLLFDSLNTGYSDDLPRNSAIMFLMNSHNTYEPQSGHISCDGFRGDIEILIAFDNRAPALGETTLGVANTDDAFEESNSIYYTNSLLESEHFFIEYYGAEDSGPATRDDIAGWDACEVPASGLDTYRVYLSESGNLSTAPEPENTVWWEWDRTQNTGTLKCDLNDPRLDPGSSSDGYRYLYVSAVDRAGNESALSPPWYCILIQRDRPPVVLPV